MSLIDFASDTTDEVSALLDTGFGIEVRKTKTVPHSNDPYITFPNLETNIQKCKLLESTVLYIDLRRSTDLNLEHKPNTVAKLYSAFVRSMTRCAIQYNGHVRGIIGDRVMVVFDREDCFANAVNTAILMNSVVQNVLNKHFKVNDIRCGIGIDYGRMLVTKTGIRRNGVEAHNYKNLVWLGRPANVASKLTDIANKSSTAHQDIIIEGHKPNQNEAGLIWMPGISPIQFLNKFSYDYLTPRLTHSDPLFRTFVKSTKSTTTRVKPITMTKVVKDGFYSERPNDKSVTSGWWSKVDVSVPGYSGDVWHGDVHFTAFTS